MRTIHAEIMNPSHVMNFHIRAKINNILFYPLFGVVYQIESRIDNEITNEMQAPVKIQLRIKLGDPILHEL